MNLLCVGRGRGPVVNLRKNLNLYLGLHLGINVDVDVGVDAVVCGYVGDEVCSRGQAVSEGWPAASIHDLSGGWDALAKRRTHPPLITREMHRIHTVNASYF